MTEDGPSERGDAHPPAEQAEDHGGPKGYPVDPGAAYESEPEPPTESFSEPEHWLGRAPAETRNSRDTDS